MKWLLAFSLFLIAQSASAVGSPWEDRDTCNATLLWAVAITGYKTLPACPKVELVPHVFLEKELCGGKACSARGRYNYAEDPMLVQIDEELDLGTVLGLSILFHELVHWLQWLNEKMPDGGVPCSLRVELEREAYLAQHMFMMKNGLPLPVVAVVPAMSCGEES